MNTSEGRPRPINAEAIEDIRDYENPAIRVLLEEEGVVESGDVINPEDYETTRSRAMVLARENKRPASAKALLLNAFTERKMLIEDLGDETIKSLPSDALRSFVYVSKGYEMTDEEMTMYRNSPEVLDVWIQGRTAAKKGAGETYVAVNEEDVVVAQAPSSQEALRRAQNENGRQV